MSMKRHTHIAARASVVNGLSCPIAAASSIQGAACTAGHAAVHAVGTGSGSCQLVQAALSSAIREAGTA